MLMRRLTIAACISVVAMSCSGPSLQEQADAIATGNFRDCLAVVQVVPSCPVRVSVGDAGATVRCDDGSEPNYESDQTSSEFNADGLGACETDLHRQFPTRSGEELAVVNDVRACLDESGIPTYPGSVSVGWDGDSVSIATSGPETDLDNLEWIRRVQACGDTVAERVQSLSESSVDG
jgi:hypothetical protein